MSTTERAVRADAATEKDALQALPRLAAKGAYAAPLIAGAGFGVFSPRDGEAQPIATLSGRGGGLACSPRLARA